MFVRSIARHVNHLIRRHPKWEGIAARLSSSVAESSRYSPWRVLTPLRSALRQGLTAAEVLEILEVLDSCGIDYWIAGGWGIDGLLGRQTRRHDDLDVIVDDFSGQADVISIALARIGFRVRERSLRDTWMPDHWELRDDGTRRVDLVSLDWDRLAVALQVEHPGLGHQDDRLREVAFATGTIGDHPVRCLSATAQRVFRSDFEHRDIDRLDLAQLDSVG